MEPATQNSRHPSNKGLRQSTGRARARHRTRDGDQVTANVVGISEDISSTATVQARALTYRSADDRASSRGAVRADARLRFEGINRFMAAADFEAIKSL